MKRFVTFIVLVGFNFSVLIKAATIHDNDGVDAQATNQTRQMGDKLNFNEFEYIKIKNLNKQRLIVINEAKAELKDNAEALKLKLSQIEKNYDVAVLNVLSPKTHAAYAQFRNTTTASSDFTAIK